MDLSTLQEILGTPRADLVLWRGRDEDLGWNGGYFSGGITVGSESLVVVRFVARFLWFSLLLSVWGRYRNRRRNSSASSL